MIQLIIGKKGSGKTKKLIDLVNATAAASKGDVVCVEKGDVLCGIQSANHDVTDIFVDATLRLGTRDYNELVAFFDRLSAVAEDCNTNFTFTVSADEAELPAHLFEVAKKV